MGEFYRWSQSAVDSRSVTLLPEELLGASERSDVLSLANEIRAGVRTRFGVELVPEPAIWD